MSIRKNKIRKLRKIFSLAAKKTNTSNFLMVVSNKKPQSADMNSNRGASFEEMISEMAKIRSQFRMNRCEFMMNMSSDLSHIITESPDVS